MSDKSIIIIGAGIAGLATGIYGQINGYKTTIFEMHDKPGGLCTAWNRQGFIFDGCIHHLAGAGPASLYYPIWEELGTAGLPMAFHDIFVQCESDSADTDKFSLYTDIERLVTHLKEVAPEDINIIDNYIDAVKVFRKLELLAIPMYSPFELAKKMSVLIKIPKLMTTSIDSFALRFKNPFLKRVFPYLQYDIPGIPLGVHLSFMAGCHNRTIGSPVTDSLSFARAMEARYRQRGGAVHYRSKVEKIITKNGKAVGIELSDKTSVYADIIISAADGKSTIFKMLDGKYTNRFLNDYYSVVPEDAQPFAAHVSLGVNRDLSHEPSALLLFSDSETEIAGFQRSHLSVELYSGNAFAPPGKGVIMVPLASTYKYWLELHSDKNLYGETKAEVTEKVIAILEKRFPGLRSQIEVSDVATPLSTERYTGNFRGMQPWPAPRGALKVMGKGLSRTLPGLDNFYMTGHWAESMIGISTAAFSGRRLVENLCKKERRVFNGN